MKNCKNHLQFRPKVTLIRLLFLLYHKKINFSIFFCLNRVTNGLNGVTNGLNRVTNGLNRVTNGLNRVTNGLNGVTNGLNGVTNGLNGVTNGLSLLFDLTSTIGARGVSLRGVKTF